MFTPLGFLSIWKAAEFLPDLGTSRVVELCRRLASGVIEAEGIVAVVNSGSNGFKVGQRCCIEAISWQSADVFKAIQMADQSFYAEQDGIELYPIINELLIDGLVMDSHSELLQQNTFSLSPFIPLAPSGYFTLDQISYVADEFDSRKALKTDVHKLLTGPTTDYIARVLASGQLRTAGIDTVSGQLRAIQPCAWRLLVDGQPQVVAALAGKTILLEAGGNPCRVLVAYFDFAKCFEADEVPEQPVERPPEWGGGASPDVGPTDAMDVLTWMKGYAQCFKDEKSSGVTIAILKQAGRHWQFTTRQIEAAYKLLPDDLRNPARTRLAERATTLRAAR